MRIDNPRFKPEDLFMETYWGEVTPPVERYRTNAAPLFVARLLRQKLRESIMPILKNEVHGVVLPKGAVYNPGNPNHDGLRQHFPGTVLLVDREGIMRSQSQPKHASTLPLDEAEATRLQLPSRKFVGDYSSPTYSGSSFAVNIWHENMLYYRSVRVQVLAQQFARVTTVAYGPRYMAVVNDPSTPMLVERDLFNNETERIGDAYLGPDHIGGFMRTTMVEICQEGSPAVEVSSKSVARLGELATE